MTQLPVRFLLLCAARTGSTMLVHSLQSHPGIVCHGELYTGLPLKRFMGLDYERPYPILSKLTEIRDRDPISFLTGFVFDGTGFEAVGFKMKYEELVLDQYRGVLDTLIEQNDIRIIHLRRRNLLKRYVSQVVATEITKIYNVTADEDMPGPITFSVGPEAALRDMDATRAREEEFRRLFAEHPCLDLEYEDMVGDYDRVMARIQRFLGVGIVDLSCGTKKIVSDRLAEVIMNMDEVSARLKGTPYEEYLS